MTATNNRMFERLDEIGYFHLNKFHKLSLRICVIWKYLHCMPSFEGLDGGISKTLNTKILPSITSNIKILGCLTSNTKKFSETLKLIQM